MWPIDLPACDVLKLPGSGARAVWAIFDPIWYRDRYLQADCRGLAEILQYYLEIGQREAHSPNRLFDERWHLAAYPAIAKAVADGRCSSAFDAYCRSGSLDRSPHWLFDELAYRALYPDLSNDVLSANEVANGYDHYLRHGAAEERIGHALFDPRVYLANFDAADVPAIRRVGVFLHYLLRIETAEPELPTSIYFDPAWYLRRYPEVAADIAAGRWMCALHHYLCNDTPTAFDPLESFSEAHYLGRQPALAEVVASRVFRNGYMHFLHFGARELRSPSPSIDLVWYAAQSSVRLDLEQGRSPNAFAHWLTIGRRKGSAAVAPEAERVGLPAARALLELQAAALLPVAGRFGYRFEPSGEPMVSVVLPLRNGFAAAMATLASLRADSALAIEVVIIDRGSADETRFIGSYVPGAKVLRFDSDIGTARAADAGRQLAAGRFVLFLSSGVLIAPGSLGRACARLADDPGAGAVGGLILQPDGLIGHAGGIVWNDGGTHDYQRGELPLTPEANFVRAVDFVSSAFMLVRADVLSRLDGFDADCEEGYHGVDLCLRIAAAGLRVIYDPSVLVFHDVGAEARGGDAGRFVAKHAAVLARRHAPGGEVQVFARHAGPAPRRILFIEDTVPLRRNGSGFVRANDIVQVMDSLGAAVTVYPINGCSQDRARIFGDMPDSVEVMHDRDVTGLRSFLAGRQGYYDTIWVARAHNLLRIAKLLQPDGPPVVLDSEAVAALREAERARLSGAPYDMEAGMGSLMKAAALCRRVVAVTSAEAEFLRSHGVEDVSVVGHMAEPRPTPRGFGQRAGMLFVGAFHTMDCPNLDSLTWFAAEVLPLIEAELGWETRLTIAGYAAPGVELDRFDSNPRITLRGAMADLEGLYNGSRVFIAPTRFAAGAPYKVFEAASRGLPVVATELLRGQLGWTAGQEILAAGSDDPAAFAAAVLAVYRDEGLWQAVREAALRRLEQENGKAGFTRAVATALAMPKRFTSRVRGLNRRSARPDADPEVRDGLE
jgi:GT2 family glycosyltransferase